MRNILKKTAFLIFAAASLLVMSCTDIASENETKSGETGTLIFSGTDLARSINPTVNTDLTDFKKVTLLGAYNGGADTVLGNWETMAEFKDAKVENVKIGKWSLTLKAETLATGGALYSDIQEVNVKGGTNPVAFQLSRKSLGTGNGSIVIDITVPSTVKSAEVLVDGTAVEATLASSKISYTDNAKAGGQYEVTVKFYGETDKKLFMNSIANVVNVGAGLTTTWRETISDVDSIYQITYNANGGDMPAGYQTYYTKASGLATLPRPTKAGFVFKGWFDNAGLSGAEVTSIATGSTGNKTFYAKWEEYVAPTITAWDFTSWSSETKANILADYAKTTWTRSDSDTSGNVSRYKSPNLKTGPVVANGVPVAELEGLLVEGNVSVSWDSSKGVCLQTAATITIPVEGGKPVVFKFANTGGSNGTRKVKITENGTERELGSSGNTTVVEKTYTPAAGTTSIIMKCYDKDGNVGQGGFNFYSIKGPVHATGIELKVDGEDSIAMKEGVSKEITATITPSDAIEKTDPITWVSSNPSVIEVVDGVLVPKAVSSATVTITATTSNGVSGTLTITGVTETVKPNSVSISCGGATTIDKLAVGSSKTITATFTPANTEATALTWSSSDPSVVSVVNGVITGVAAGNNVTITATTVNGKTATITVTEVIDPSSITDSIVFGNTGGWFRACYAEWYPVKNSAITGYNAYISTNGTTWDPIDKELIRGYAGNAGGSAIHHYRVDAMGLAQGNYKIKVVAVAAGAESAVSGETGYLEVKPFERNGFAFHGNYLPGAYKADGTLKDNAVVVYVNNSNFNSVTLKTKNSSNKEVTFASLQEALDGGWFKECSTPVCVRVLGKIDKTGFPTTSWGSSAEGLQVKGNKNYAEMSLTIEGVGEDAVFHGFGFLIRATKGVEVSNLALMDFKDDGVSLDTGNSNTWIHNMDIFYGAVGSDSDQKKGDGSLDSKGDTKLQSYSYNHFWDSGKCNLCGMTSESGPNYLTYDHNWYDHSDSRHPRIRTMSVHVYNNYFDGNSKYGVGTTMGSDAFVENNYFRNAHDPMMIAGQGTDGGSTFSGESGGMIKAYNNVFAECNTNGVKFQYAPYSASNTIEFDSYEVANRSDTVPSTVKCKLGNDTYNNFDTDPQFYIKNLVPDTPEDAKSKVISYAGRMNGGDFRWTFNNAVDDKNDTVDDTLKANVVNYQSKLHTSTGSTVVAGNGASGGNNGGSDPIPTTPTLTLTPTTATINVGGTATLTATLTNGTSGITWTSSDTSKATVTPSADGTSCVVTGVGGGTASITVASEGAASKTCTVTINGPTLTVTPGTVSLAIGGTTTLTATLTNASGTVTWSTSNSSIATVDSNGVVTANAVGEATITASAAGLTGTCVVTVIDPSAEPKIWLPGDTVSWLTGVTGSKSTGNRTVFGGMMKSAPDGTGYVSVAKGATFTVKLPSGCTKITVYMASDDSSESELTAKISSTTVGTYTMPKRDSDSTTPMVVTVAAGSTVDFTITGAKKGALCKVVIE